MLEGEKGTKPDWGMLVASVTLVKLKMQTDKQR
jgi:hypothetical protein